MKICQGSYFQLDNLCILFGNTSRQQSLMTRIMVHPRLYPTYLFVWFHLEWNFFLSKIKYEVKKLVWPSMNRFFEASMLFLQVELYLHDKNFYHSWRFMENKNSRSWSIALSGNAFDKIEGISSKAPLIWSRSQCSPSK